MRICSNCSLKKQINEFYKQDTCKFGIRPECKDCTCKKRKERHKNLSKERKMEIKKQMSEYSKEYIKTEHGQKTRKNNHRKYHLQSTYGITIEIYDNLCKNQNNKCLICKREEKLYIDHDHKTGQIRGLLCNNCNTGIGQFKESIDNLESAIKYLKLLK